MTRTLALLVVVLALPLTGCPRDRSGCTRTEPAASGPGDALALFPAAVGDLWAYRVAEDGTPYRSRVEVVGPATVGGRAGLRLTATSMGWPSPLGSVAVVAVEPGGVSVLEADDLDGLAPGLDALVGPRLLLRFPVATGDSFTSYDCQGLAAGSVDDDARNDPIDVRAVVTVLGEEEVATPDGPRLAVRIDTRIDLTVHSSQVGTVAFTSQQRDWYAPGLGLVQSTATFSTPGLPSSSASTALYAWSVGGSGFGPVTGPLELATGVVTLGEVAPEGWQVYRTTVPDGAPLLVGLFGLDGARGLGGAGGVDATWWDCRQPATADPQRCLVPAGAGEVAFEVDGGASGAPGATYAMVAAPCPEVAAPAEETLTLARGEVAAGQVGARGTSVYTVTGLTPGVPITVALVGATGAADLRWAPGVPPDPLDTCWIEWSAVLPAAEQCTLTPAGDTAAFAVVAGAVEHLGATYLVAAW